MQRQFNEILLHLLQANGELYYFSTMVAFGVITYVHPQLWVSVYDNFGPILGGLNVFALALCLYLLVKAKLKTVEDDPYLLNNVGWNMIESFYLLNVSFVCAEISDFAWILPWNGITSYNIRRPSKTTSQLQNRVDDLAAVNFDFLFCFVPNARIRFWSFS